jgi:hypothetical protein
MLGFSQKKEHKKKVLSKKDDQLAQDIKKVLGSSSQNLILMVRS